MNRRALFCFVISCVLLLAPAGISASSEAGEHKNETERYKLVVFDFDRVELPLVICLWILIVALAKIAFHLNSKLPTVIPESCLLIVMGLIVGALLHFTHIARTDEYVLNADVFFIYLLPPIIFDAGYFMPVRAFFDNLGTILLLAFVNTCISAGLIAVSLYGISLLGWFGRTISILDCFIFSSLISAVDPVAVLSVFEEVHVNQMLYIIVFGESLLNDGVTVVLYHMFEGFIEIGEENLIPVDIVTGLGSFFIVALGGTLIGIVFGFFGGFITKYTEHVKVIEPLFVFVIGYLMYLSAEMCHLSSILALSFGGIVLRHYLEANVSRSTRTSVRYFMKMLANISETIIFMFLGLSAIVDTLDWNLSFIFFALLFCLIFRGLGVMFLSWILNRRRLVKLSGIDQFIMAYGGLRGGIAFCLALSLEERLVPEKSLFVTATIVIVFFTVFVQGITIKPVVNALKVKKEEDNDPKMTEKIQESFMDHLMAGMEGITKHSSHNLMRIKFRHFNHNYLKPLFNKEAPQTKAKKVLEVYHTISVAEALDQVGNEVDVSQRKPLVSSGASNVYRRTPSGLVNTGFRVENMANEQVEPTNQNESLTVNMEDPPIYKCVEDPVVKETVVIEKPRSSPPVGGGSNAARKESDKSETSDEFENVTIRFKQPVDDAHGVDQITENSDLSSESYSIAETNSEPSTVTYANEKESPCEIEPLQLPLPWKKAPAQESQQMGVKSDVPNTVEPIVTAAESVFPWKKFPRDPIPFSSSLAYSDDSAPIVAEAPTWVNNLSYSHLKESGSPYASPEVTLIPEHRQNHTSIFDLFKRDDPIEKCLDACVAKLNSALDETDSKSHASGDTIPPPWSHHGEDADNIPVPSMKETYGVKNNLLLSNHTLPPPSHHVILPTVHFSEDSITQSHSDDGEVHKPLKSLPGSASAPDLPKHFQVIEPMTKSRLHSESMLEDLDFHDQAVSRVNEWLSATISEEAGIVIPIHVPTPELSSDNDADCSSEGEGDDDDDWDFDRDDL
ncbi:sodium/hydrogen exchanger 3-like [Saccostrea cucullata]|uniref:sodium/hydrogen exchanger 3-like n=1 Tax=Saccostrea cuccullata TaxID=36930 RepID=UPI002ED0869E